MRLSAGRIGLTALGLLVGLGLAEGAVRWINPRPRVQVISPAEQSLTWRVDDGVAVWRHDDWEQRRNEACDRGRTVVWLGCSIDFGVHVPYRQTFVGLLDEALADEGVCVINLAQPGFVMEQNLAELRAWEAAHGAPDLVVLDAWAAFPARYRQISSAAWAQLPASLPVDTDLPLPSPFPLPASWHRALLEHSLLWQRLVLAIVPTAPGRQDQIAELVQAVQSLGDRNLLVMNHRTVDGNQTDEVPREAQQIHPFPMVDLPLAMEGIDPRPLYLSDIHFTPEGHRWAFERLLPAVRSRLTEAPASP
jgi:hypothetical protein